MSITDEQAKIIGQEIGQEIASSWYGFTNPTCRTSLSDKISNSIKDGLRSGFDLLAMEIRRGQDMEARRRRADLQDENG